MRTRFLILILVCATLGARAETGPGPVILILFANPDGALEDRLRAELKAARDEVGLSQEEAPIQRLYWSVEHHRPRLKKLGITPDQLPWVGFGNRDSLGWPERLEERMPQNRTAAEIIERYSARYLRSPPRWGLLLVEDRSQPNWDKESRIFIRELGLLALQRDGKISVDEIPVFGYDLSSEEQADYVRDVLGVKEQAPLALVVEFDGRRPRRTLGRANSISTPALASRLLWGTLQSAGPATGDSVLPGPACRPLDFSDEGLVACVIRTHELSKQLHESLEPSEDEPRASRDLLGLVEQSGLLRRQLQRGDELPWEAIQRLLSKAADFRSNQGSLRLDRPQQELLRQLLLTLEQTESAQRRLLRQ